MKTINFNENWEFSHQLGTRISEKDQWEKISIPHTNISLPFHYFDESRYQMVCYYRKKITLDQQWKGKRIFIQFDGVAHVATISLNGVRIASHYGGYTSFSVELTKFLNWKSENILLVEVDSNETNNVPPFGGRIDYMTYGGIYREVTLHVKEDAYLSDVFIHTTNVL